MLGVGQDGPTLGGRRADGSPVGRPPVQGEPGSPRAGQRDAERDARLDAERDAWVIMASVDGLGPVAFGALLRRFGNGRSVLEIALRPDGRQILSAAPDPHDRLETTVAGRLVTAAHEQDLILGRAAGLGLTVVTLEDARFPFRLLAVELPPHLLFIQGDIGALSSAHALAVVGTRHPTEHGRRLAARVAAAASEAGATVVSGLAVGIDGAAHAAAVGAGRPTVAVLGSGHARLFPRAHRRLAEGIVDSGGAVVSEFFPDVGPTKGTFPRRNRLISGLADATVVVEAPLRSGALITASWALEQGRECFLVPGPIDAPTSAGCLAFLREHWGAARIVAGIPELVEDLGLVGLATGGPRMTAHVELSTIERALADALTEGASTTDDLVHAVRQPVATVLGGITVLEMRGLVVSAYGRHRLAGRLAGAEPPRLRRAPIG
jgi:DNA processing protein